MRTKTYKIKNSTEIAYPLKLINWINKVRENKLNCNYKVKLSNLHFSPLKIHWEATCAMKHFNFSKTAAFNGKLPSKHPWSVTCWVFSASLQHECHPLAAAALPVHKPFTPQHSNRFTRGKNPPGFWVLSCNHHWPKHFNWRADPSLPEPAKQQSVLTSLIQQWQHCSGWCLADFHHHYNSRVLLPCLHKRTSKGAGVSYAKYH